MYIFMCIYIFQSISSGSSIATQKKTKFHMSTRKNVPSASTPLPYHLVGFLGPYAFHLSSPSGFGVLGVHTSVKLK